MKCKCKNKSKGVCGGNLTAHVQAVSENYEYAALEVYFECDSCGSTIHNYLPNNQNTLEKFLTNVVKEMP